MISNIRNGEELIEEEEAIKNYKLALGKFLFTPLVDNNYEDIRIL